MSGPANTGFPRFRFGETVARVAGLVLGLLPSPVTRLRAMPEPVT